MAEFMEKVKAKGKIITTTGDGEIIDEREDPEVLLVRETKEMREKKKKKEKKGKKEKKEKEEKA